MAERITCKKKHCVSGRCKKARRCACDVCGPLKNISSTLFESCIDVCQHDPRPSDMETYLCGTVSPQVLYNSYGLELCGFSAPANTGNNVPLGPPVNIPMPSYPQLPSVPTNSLPQVPIISSSAGSFNSPKEEKSKTSLYLWVALGAIAVICTTVLILRNKS